VVPEPAGRLLEGVSDGLDAPIAEHLDEAGNALARSISSRALRCGSVRFVARLLRGSGCLHSCAIEQTVQAERKPLWLRLRQGLRAWVGVPPTLLSFYAAMTAW
jgi:hypothetical protein